MQTTISLPVSQEAAEQYASSTPEERLAVQAIIESFFTQKRTSNVAHLKRLMDQMSDEAAASGLTPEMVQAIIDEEE